MSRSSCVPMSSVGYCHRNRMVEIDRFRFAPTMEHAPEPAFVARLPAVLHEVARDAIGVVGSHAQTPVRSRLAETLDFTRAMDVVVRLLEEDLHELHRIVFRSRWLCRLALCPRLVGRHPGRIPNDLSNTIMPAR